MKLFELSNDILEEISYEVFKIRKKKSITRIKKRMDGPKANI